MTSAGRYPFPAGRGLTVAECVERAGIRATIMGDAARTVFAVAHPNAAEADSLCFCDLPGPEGLARLRACRAGAVIIREDLAVESSDAVSRTLVCTSHPMLLFARLAAACLPDTERATRSPNAVVHPQAVLAEGVSVGPFAVIEGDCIIGSNTIVGPSACLRRGTRVGYAARIEPHAVVGAVGLAFARDLDGSYEFLPHLGNVVIGDHVVVGSGSIVVRGILQDTVIGSGSKLGNCVNVGHNTIIGERCFVASGAILCGSVVIENDCWIGAGAVILNHVRVGAGAKVALGSVVTRDVSPRTVVAGNPARMAPPGEK